MTENECRLIVAKELQALREIIHTQTELLAALSRHQLEVNRLLLGGEHRDDPYGLFHDDGDDRDDA